MPKKVYDAFVRSLYRDIVSNYSSGDKYLSVREISEKFSVSLQTAQKGVKELKESGLIASKPNSGITVTAENCGKKRLAGKVIYVISNKQDGHFYSSFFEGARDYASDFEIRTEFKMNTFKNTSSLEFGEYLVSLDADGLVLLSFPNSELPIYHAMREGVDIVSDIILDNLPVLPAVQTHNYKHAHEAGEELARKGCTEFFIFGYYKRQRNRRLEGFDSAVREAGFRARYVEMSSADGISEASEILKDCTDSTGIFISDYASAYVIDSLCTRRKLRPKHILIYDTDGEYFQASSLPPIRAVAPSFRMLGQRLCHCLVCKWQSGKYPEPLQLKI